MKIGNGVDIMKLCMNCFESKNKCNCAFHYYVDIDDDFIEHIQLLNKKGYYTKYCCSGHIDDIWFRPYISFEHRYDFETTPKFFHYEKRFDGLYYTVKWENNTDMEWRQKIINESHKALLDWIKSLPMCEESYND